MIHSWLHAFPGPRSMPIASFVCLLYMQTESPTCVQRHVRNAGGRATGAVTARWSAAPAQLPHAAAAAQPGMMAELRAWALPMLALRMAGAKAAAADQRPTYRCLFNDLFSKVERQAADDALSCCHERCQGYAQQIRSKLYC